MTLDELTPSMIDELMKTEEWKEYIAAMQVLLPRISEIAKSAIEATNKEEENEK